MNMRSCWSRRASAFTLVELLVVVAIIGILIALLLPAVQAAREAARRAQCANHLKQISLAVLEYEEAWEVFPVNFPQDACHDEPLQASTGKGWMVGILPLLEQGGLHDSMDFQGTMKDGHGLLNVGNRQYIERTPAPYLCPSDSSSGKTRDDIWHFPQQYNVPLSTMNYAGVVGPHSVIVNSDLSTFGGLTYCNSYCWNRMRSCTGSFWNHSYMAPVRMATFEDGASNTYIVGEIVPEFDSFKVWALGNSSIAFTSVPLNYLDPAGVGIWGYPDHMGFRSRHAGGAQFAYADGRVTFLSETTDHEVYRGLSTRRGGEVVQPPH